MKSVFCGIALSCLSFVNAMEHEGWSKESSCSICDIHERIDSLCQKVDEIQKENQLLKEQLDKVLVFGSPDYGKEISKVWGVPYIAEQNGLVKLKACVTSGANDEAMLYINEALVLRIAICSGCIAGAQIAPVWKGDRYIATGHPHDGTVSFFSCR
ncbi:MAG: hypothetical protein LBG20_00800 [Holosporaceae bacterium]|jgi:hypothetical protein|nr:hypothetical protein [Holosporaceae bacterium]